MKANFRSILILVLMVALVVFAVSVFSGSSGKKESFTYSQIKELFKEEMVYKFNVDGDLKLSLQAYVEDSTSPDGHKHDKNGELVYKTYEYQLSYNFQLQEINDLADELTQNGGLEGGYNFATAAQTPWYQVYLPYIILTLVFIVSWIFIMRQTGGSMGKMNSFSKSHAKVTYNDKDPVKFCDVAGADEEKAELEEIVEFLKDPAKFTKLGARIPRGVLLVGPPGTGKTLLAKAVAGEAGVPFFSISGSDFVEMYVGVGASRVRDLFDTARKTPASIIFIDEIDAVGRHRGAGLGGGHDEREQTLNQILVEMDGFGTQSGVIVLAATNRPDILDPALLRPGRFDRRVTVNYPDLKGREAILHVHARNKPLEETVDFSKIAQSTIGFTGADLANLLNESAIRAAKKNKILIGMDEIEESYMKLLLGPQKKVNVRTPEDNKLCAYHEAGHAVAAFYCEHANPVKHITIIPAGNAGGVTINPPVKDSMTASKNQMMDDIVMCLGGRVAEELVIGDVSTGASSDIQKATSTARNMVTRYGMSEKLGAVLYASERTDDEIFLGRDFSSGKNYSEQTASLIDEEIHTIIDSCYNRCKTILQEHNDKLSFVAEFLLKHESMDAEQFRHCMVADDPKEEDLIAITEEKKKKSEKENIDLKEKMERMEAEARSKEEAEKAKNQDQTSKDDAMDDFMNFFSRDAKPKDDSNHPKNDEK